MAHSTEGLRLDHDMGDRLTRGGGGWQLVDTPQDLWAWADVFTPEECDSIIEVGRSATLCRATTTGSEDDPRRDSSVAFLYPDEMTGWIFRKLAGAIVATNAFFGFDLTQMMEGIQFTEYRAPGQNYGWHVDAGPSVSIRKLSLVVQLTDPDEYEGGELELNPHGDGLIMGKVRGRAYAFPSWTLHRVKPMVTGTRHSLVVWVTGPAFR